MSQGCPKKMLIADLLMTFKSITATVHSSLNGALWKMLEVAEISPEERKHVRRSMEKALRKSLKIAKAEAKGGKATKESMDACPPILSCGSLRRNTRVKA
jgi:hypothetical protein